MLFRPFRLLWMSWTLDLYLDVGMECVRGEGAFEKRKTVNRVLFIIDSFAVKMCKYGERLCFVHHTTASLSIVLLHRMLMLLLVGCFIVLSRSSQKDGIIYRTC